MRTQDAARHPISSKKKILFFIVKIDSYEFSHEEFRLDMGKIGKAGISIL